MNDIDFIKKSVPFADGFELMVPMDNSGGYYLVLDGHQVGLDTNRFKKIWFPHFLTRTIEGLPKIIRVSKHYIEIGDRDDPEYGRRVSDFENIDQAKRSAIEYVLERIK